MCSEYHMYSIHAGHSYHHPYSRMLSKSFFQKYSLIIKNVPACKILRIEN